MKFYFHLLWRHDNSVDLMATEEGEGSIPSGLKASPKNFYFLISFIFVMQRSLYRNSTKWVKGRDYFQLPGSWKILCTSTSYGSGSTMS